MKLIRWIVQNQGDEACEAEQLPWNSLQTERWTSTVFKGPHTMTCQIERSGVVLDRAIHFVRVTPSGWWRRFV